MLPAQEVYDDYIDCLHIYVFRCVCFLLLSHSNTDINNSIKVTVYVRENNLFATYKVKNTGYIPAHLITFCSGLTVCL